MQPFGVWPMLQPMRPPGQDQIFIISLTIPSPTQVNFGDYYSVIYYFNIRQYIISCKFLDYNVVHYIHLYFKIFY